MSRDPRYDPREGDVLEHNGATFKVIKRQPRTVWVEADGEHQKAGYKLHQWRRFLEGAEVVEVAS